MQNLTPSKTPICVIACLITAPVYAADEIPAYEYVTYVDAGYAYSNRDPSDDSWRSKSSTATVNDPAIYLAMANIRKNTATDSRWGFEFGLQAGDDSEGLVTSAPPAANEPLSDADELRHFYRANVAYMFGDNTVKTTFGLINSYIGYESYLAIDNPNYSRAYLSDTVPYLLFGLETMWAVNDDIDLGFYLLNGYNYLTDPNDIPSAGLSGKFRLTPHTTFIQNFYYGSDQQETDIDYWRFFSNSILEWRSGKWLVAGSLDYGREKQADQPGTPTYQWSTGALWVEWSATERLSLAFRPEFHLDDDGLATGTIPGGQRLQAYTGTLKYEFNPRMQRLIGTLEVRYDKSSGTNGGFFDQPDDTLVGDQTLVIAGIQWQFGN